MKFPVGCPKPVTHLNTAIVPSGFTLLMKPSVGSVGEPWLDTYQNRLRGSQWTLSGLEEFPFSNLKSSFVKAPGTTSQSSGANSFLQLALQPSPEATLPSSHSSSSSVPGTPSIPLGCLTPSPQNSFLQSALQPS